MKRNILVVEDDPNWQNRLKTLCQNVLAELHQDQELRALYIDAFFDNSGYTVETASTLDEANKVIQTSHHIHHEGHPLPDSYFGLITVDINLHDARPGSSEGLDLLASLVSENQTVITIVVSAEARTYAKEILRRYRTFESFDKGRFDYGEFKAAVKAAVLYSDALKLLDTWNWTYVKTAATLWRKLQTIELDYKPDYIVDIADKINNRVDSTNQIPNDKWTHRVLFSLLSAKNWALANIGIVGLERFATFRGDEEASAVTKYLAAILAEVIEEKGQNTDFIGCYYGGFVLVSTPERLNSLLQDIQERFQASVHSFYSRRDQVSAEEGYVLFAVNGKTEKEPILKLAAGKVTVQDSPNTVNELAAIMADRRREKLDQE